ncbi:hypothetical protein ES703_110043 [subsurface metagenome]
MNRHIPHIPVIIQKNRDPLFYPSYRTNRGFDYIMVIFLIDKRGGNILGNVVFFRRSHFKGVIMPVIIIQQVASIRGRSEIPATFLKGEVAGSCLQVINIDILIASSFEISHQFVFLVVKTDSPAKFRSRYHLSYFFIGKSQKFFLFDTVDTKIAEIFIPFFLNLLHGLKPFIQPMPDDKVGWLFLFFLFWFRFFFIFVLFFILFYLLFFIFFRSFFRFFLFFFLFFFIFLLFYFVDAEQDPGQIFCPHRGSVRADCHRIWKIFILFGLINGFVG